MARPLEPLPIDPLLPRITAAVAEHRGLVLRSPTGSGKTTRVPPALLDGGAVAPGLAVWVLEPRRVAARAAARRIAAERGGELGAEVGYQVRGEVRAGRGTRILVMTEGVLLRRLQQDPLLSGVGAVVFDEFHERSLEADLALALTREVQREVRPDLALVVMSATLDTAPLVRFLGGCPEITAEGRGFPLTVRYHPRPVERNPRALAGAVAAAAGTLLEETAGDLLVFLPGVGEIRAAESALAPLAARREIQLVPLYGDLPAAEQDAALTPQAGRQGPRTVRIVLATNVAESSVTVPGVRAVIDSGLARALRYHPGSGLNRLELGRISRAAADQRAGRAGREAPGLVWRLWPEQEHPTLPTAEPPEVARLDLSGAVLQLLAWGQADAAAFAWFEAPPAESLTRALDLLGALEAWSPSRGLTAHGRHLAQLPLHPRLGALLLAGHRAGHPRDAALAAALLAERSPFSRPQAGAPPPAPSPSDVMDRVEALLRFQRFQRSERRGAPGPEESWGRLQPGPARGVLDLAARLEQDVHAALGPPPDPAPGPRRGRDEALTQALLAAHPDRVARRREGESHRAVMVGGRGLRLAPESAVAHLPGADLLLAVEVEAGAAGERAEGLARLVVALDPSDLPTAEAVDLSFDPERERVVARKRRTYRDLTLEEKELPLGAADAEAVSACLVAAASAALASALPLADPAVERLRARISFLAHHRPDLGLPAVDDDALRALLPLLCAGKRSFAELRKLPLAETLMGQLPFLLRQTLDHEAPERLRVPSGREFRVEYRGAEPPVFAVPIQDLFGLATTPRLAGGRVPVLLHLLAPNRRPQQVTQDLASFWHNTYPQVRRELQGRYPKHAWPADPGVAQGPFRRSR